MTPPDPTPTADAKRALRSRLRAARRARVSADPTAPARLFDGLHAAVAPLAPDAGVVAGYLAAPGEPDVGPALASWHEQGASVVVPLSLPGRTLAWVRWHPDLPVRTGDVAPVPEPVGGVPADDLVAELILVPALAVGGDGTRLGQGGGFYDRFLDSASGVTVGVVFSDEVLPSVPSDPWDAQLEAVVTPEGLRRFGTTA